MGAAIVSVDSMQVYRGMDIGTAKPSAADRERLPHHLVDIAEPEDDFTVAEFQAAGRAVLDRLVAAGAPALITGGSGLHFRALVDPLDFPPSDPKVRAAVEGLEPAAARERLLLADPAAGYHVDLANPRRVIRALEVYEVTGATPSERAARPEADLVRSYEPRYPVRAVGVDPGDALESRAARRIDRMHEDGLVAEVAKLAPRLGRTAGQAVNYKEVLPLVAGACSVEDAKAEQLRATMALAKRQRTFFRRDPRIRWLPWSDDPAARVAAAQEALEEVPPWSS